MTFLIWLLFTVFLLAGFGLTLNDSLKAETLKASKGLPFFALAIAMFIIGNSVVTVDAGQIGVVTRMGAVTGTLEPGPHLVTPFVTHVHPMSVQTLVVKPDSAASSRDLQIVHTQVTLSYHFDPSHIAYIYSQLADASDNSVENKVIVPAILEAIKASTAQYDAQQLISERPAVRDRIEEFVKQRLAGYHIVPETVSITDFRFSDEYEKAIEAKVTAQQQAEKAQNDLQRIKVEADQKVAAAQGEAQALRAQKEQITPELLQLRMIEMLKEKWDGQLPQNYYGGSAPLPIVEALKAERKTK